MSELVKAVLVYHGVQCLISIAILVVVFGLAWWINTKG